MRADVVVVVGGNIKVEARAGQGPRHRDQTSEPWRHKVRKQATRPSYGGVAWLVGWLVDRSVGRSVGLFDNRALSQCARPSFFLSPLLLPFFDISARVDRARVARRGVSRVVQPARAQRIFHPTDLPRFFFFFFFFHVFGLDEEKLECSDGNHPREKRIQPLSSGCSSSKPDS